MLLFFFYVTDDGDVPHVPDDIGTEHPSKECIPAEAADLLANFAWARLLDGTPRTVSVKLR